MTWRDRRWPDANPVYPIDYHPGSRHTARGLSRALQNFYHGLDWHGTILGCCAPQYQANSLVSATSGLGVPPAQINSDLTGELQSVLCHNVTGIKYITASFLVAVSPRYDFDPEGDWTGEAQVRVEGTTSGSADSDEVEFPISQTPYDSRLIGPGGWLRTMVGIGTRQGQTPALVETSFGWFAGRITVDVDGVDFGASAGLRVVLAARAYDTVPRDLFVSPSFMVVSGQIAER